MTLSYLVTQNWVNKIISILLKLCINILKNQKDFMNNQRNHFVSFIIPSLFLLPCTPIPFLSYLSAPLFFFFLFFILLYFFLFACTSRVYILVIFVCVGEDNLSWNNLCPIPLIVFNKICLNQKIW